MTQNGDLYPVPRSSTLRAAARASWGWTVMRGVLTLAAGLLALIWPGAAFLSLAILFGVYAFVDGLAEIVTGLSSRSGGVRWPLILAGLLGLAAGTVSLFNPGLAALTLLWVIAGWAVVRGVLSIAAAIRWRTDLPGAGEWLVGLGGLLSVGLGILLILNPREGILTTTVLVGIYVVAAGVVLIVLGFRMRNL